MVHIDVMAHESLANVTDWVRDSNADPRVWRFVQSHPWRASVSARRAIAFNRSDDVAWAVLGLAQSLLAHHKYAISAYRQARRLVPSNPWYAHNLGHLLDVAAGKPHDAVPLLAHAYATLCEPSDGPAAPMGSSRREIVTSYAHALWRCGYLDDAKRLLLPLVRGRASPAEHELYASILDHIEIAWQQHAKRLPVTSSASPRRVLRRRCTR